MTIPNSVNELAFALSGAGTPLNLTGGGGALYFETAGDIHAAYIDPAGVIHDWVNGTDFTVAGNGMTGSGVLTLITATVAASVLRVWRVTQRTQPAQYTELSSFPAATQQSVEDRNRLIDQDLERKANKALRFGDEEPAPAVLSNPARKGHVLGFTDDAAATPVFSTHTMAELDQSVDNAQEAIDLVGAGARTSAALPTIRDAITASGQTVAAILFAAVPVNNQTGVALTIFLDAAPADGAALSVKDIAGTCTQAVPIIIDGNGKNIDVEGQYIMVNPYQDVQLRYKSGQWWVWGP